MLFHVHVYQVALKGEVNIDAKTIEEAEQRALEMAKNGEVSLKFPDCQCIALGFDM